MSLIQVLDEQVANQIAAGEVVERPASAVKELVENAIDSGATNIEVRIKVGGLELMEVLDNGGGIPESEIETAFIRHATSKLRQISDFSHLKTLGFRGEALPSIAAVSKVTIRTREPSALAGTEIQYIGGEKVARQPIGAPIGTRMQVNDLFFNTPARLKFVRSLQTETGHIVDVVSKAAITHPQIAFTLVADDRVMLQTVGDGQLLSVFAAIYGANVAKMAMAVIGDHPDYHMTGLVAAPEHARASRNVMWFAVNGRPIRSPMLVSAVLDGFGTTYHKGRFPITFLSLVMDPALVDVNVHPGKLEVRFSEEKDVRQFVIEAVKNALVASAHIPDVGSLDADVVYRGGNSGAQADFSAPMAPQTLERKVEHTVERENGQQRLSERQAAFSWEQRVAKDTEASRQAAFLIQQPIVEEKSPTLAEWAANDMSTKDFRPSPVESVEAPRGELRAVAQVLKMFIVAEDGESVYLIDQHAAHERVLYERFRAKLHASTVRAMELLVPMTFSLRPHEVDAMLRQLPVAENFGLLYESFGDDAVLVRAIPNIWEGLDAHALVREVFDHFLDEKDVSPFAKLEDKVIMSACKAAIKANQRLSIAEMDALLRALAPLDNPFTCPHGRPTALKITRADLERRFFRS